MVCLLLRNPKWDYFLQTQKLFYKLRVLRNPWNASLKLKQHSRLQTKAPTKHIYLISYDF